MPRQREGEAGLVSELGESIHPECRVLREASSKCRPLAPLGLRVCKVTAECHGRPSFLVLSTQVHLEPLFK